MEYNILVVALEKSGVADLSGFKLEGFHEFDKMGEGGGHYWGVILIPMLTRIYLIGNILNIVKPLSIDVACYTDINRPGCLIFH